MKTILLVEDDSARLIGLSMILRSCGYAVLEAGNRDEAIQTCLGHPGPIKVLLTDLELRGNDRPLLAERLLALSPEMRVLFMISSPPDILVDGGPLPYGCTFLLKPFGQAALGSAVEELLESPGLASHCSWQ